MKKSIGFSAIFIFLLVSFNVQAQQWSVEQKEVWATIETYWGSEDVTEYLKHFDESFVGWAYDSEAPDDISVRSKVTKYIFANTKWLFYTITPARIWVKENFAFAHYYYTFAIQDKDGKEKWQSGRYTDILMKKGNKWVLIGDHGGKTSK
jgi:hypothetical protein